jgi:hypothetical protein
MTAEGLNLAGVEMVLALESQVQRLRAEVARLRKRLEEVGAAKGENGDGGAS